MTNRRPFLGIFAATALMAGMAVTMPSPPAVAAETIRTATNGAPASIPGLSNWTAGTGGFQFETDTRVLAGAGTEAEAATLAADLGAALETSVQVAAGTQRPGDVTLTLDATRSAVLGEEGYAIEVGEGIEVTAATEAGLFYGGQTAVQWAVLAGTTATIPAGNSVDVPAYPIRSVGICACIVNISMEKFEQVIKEMAYYKMNELWIELKVESEAYPEATFWSYYTNEQAAHLAEFAARHHIELVPEVNSPGHMGPWLQNLPHLQLVNATGERQPTQLDISKPEALEVVKNLASEYIEKFDLDWYHMGADEYLLGAGSFDNYPQIIAAAREKFGANATEHDLFVWFINEVNAHVKTQGANLRIWNDGIPAQDNIEKLDSDIMVEYWYRQGRTMQKTLSDGNDVVNTDNRLYFTRNGAWGTAEARWNENWTPHTYYGAAIDDTTTPGKILGGKMVLWPDNGPGTTENALFAQIHDTLRFLAQATWSKLRPTTTYAAFNQLGQQLGNGPDTLAIDYAPLIPGDYTIRSDGMHLTVTDGVVAMTDTEATWSFSTTSDGYYKIAQGDQCLAMAAGDSLNLSAPNTFGQKPIVTACTSTPREAGNLQKWWIRQVEGGYTLSNAISNMPLVVAGAAVAQQDPNVAAGTAFAMVGDGVATTAGSLGRLLAGVTVRVPVTVRNLEDVAVSNVVVSPVVPEGWLVDVGAAEVGSLAGQAGENLTFRITPNAGPAGAQVLEFVTSWTDASGAARERTTSVPLTFSCTANVTAPSEVVRVSSEQDDLQERAPATNVIDGNPNTFWHTQWNGSEPAHPHQIVVGLAAESEICAVTLTPRQGVSSGAVNGQIKGFELYVTSDRAVATNTAGTPGAVPAGWTKVAEGNLPAGQSPQWIPFTQTVKAQYILLVAKSAQNASHPWTTLGEFSVDLVGDDTTPPVAVAGDVSLEQGKAASIRVAAADASSLTFEATGLPAGLSIDASGVISGTTTADTGQYPVSVEVTDAQGLSTTVAFTITVTPKANPSPTPTKPTPTKPTKPVTTPPAGKFMPTAPYTKPGLHTINGRQWNTACEAYSQTERCRTEIWATVVVIEEGEFVRKSGWAFNNLTYLPYMTREAWAANPLGHTAEWTAASDGRKWKTECDTAATGRNGCRSYTYVTVYTATPKSTGGYAFSQSNEWVFNNIVMLGSPSLR
ncbi:family 20 glycosylhydrolase [Tessaracoccus lubricantis]